MARKPRQTRRGRKGIKYMNNRGEPTEDCLVCKLKEQLNEVKKEIDGIKEERKEFNQVMAEALENAFVEGWEGCVLSGEVSNKYQWKHSDAKKLADNLLKGI
jgi:hypothetical protein